VSTLWQKVLADFSSNKTRTFLMVLTIALGVFALGFIGNIQAMMNHDMDADFTSANPAEARVYAGVITDDWVRAMGKVPGVRTAQGRSQVTAQLLKENGSKATIQFNIVKSLQSITVGMLKPANALDGSLPLLQRRDVVLDRSASELGFQVGQILSIELVDGKTRELRFAGYVHDVTAFPYNMTGLLTGYVVPETGEWLGGPAPSQYNQLLVSVSENPTDREHVSEVAQAIADRFENDKVTIARVSINANPGRHFAWQVLQSAMIIMNTLGWMAVLLSGFLIVNTIMSLMSQHIRQIGIMKAIGAGIWQIFFMYLMLLLLFGALALVISIPLAALASYRFCAFMAGFLNYQLGSFFIDFDTAVLQTILAIAVPILAALAPLINSIRIPVREALNNYGIGNVGGKNSGATNALIGIFPRPVLISMRNAFRRRLRVSLTLFALTLGGAIFIAVFNHWQALDQSMQDTQGYFLADINFSFTRAHRFEELKAITETFPGVEHVEGWLTADGLILSDDDEHSDQVQFLAPPSDSTMIHAILTDGRWLTPLDQNAIVIGNHLLKIRPDLKVGDWVTIKINEQKKAWQIVGIYRMPGNMSPPWLYTNYEYLSALLHQPHMVYSLRVNIREHDAQAQDYLARQLQDMFGQRDISVSYVQQGAEWLAQQRSQTNVIAYFLLFMATLIAFVGGLGLMGLMSINVMERTREIGVMRAIGASAIDIQGVVVTEGLVIGLVSWGLALFLSVPITYMLDYSIGVSIFQAPLTVVFNWVGSSTWLLGVLVISTLASAIPAWRASRLTVRDTLVYE
jgi:putative ABC transport system permease protein